MKIRSVRLKKLLKKLIFTDLVEDVFDGRHPFDLDRLPPEQVRYFGDANPDRTFYVIWRDSLGSGFFSNFTQVLSHIQRAEELGMTPVVDFENFRTLYNVEEPVGGSRNAWEYYFAPVSPYPLAEVYRSQRVYFCRGDYPRGYSFQSNAEYRAFLASHIRHQAPVEERIGRYAGEFSRGDVLGIHFRGKEINTAAGHSFGPSAEQSVRHADRLLDLSRHRGAALRRGAEAPLRRKVVFHRRVPRGARQRLQSVAPAASPLSSWAGGAGGCRTPRAFGGDPVQQHGGGAARRPLRPRSEARGLHLQRPQLP